MRCVFFFSFFFCRERRNFHLKVHQNTWLKQTLRLPNIHMVFPLTLSFLVFLFIHSLLNKHVLITYSSENTEKENGRPAHKELGVSGKGHRSSKCRVKTEAGSGGESERGWRSGGSPTSTTPWRSVGFTGSQTAEGARQQDVRGSPSNRPRTQGRAPGRSQVKAGSFTRPH